MSSSKVSFDEDLNKIKRISPSTKSQKDELWVTKSDIARQRRQVQLGDLMNENHDLVKKSIVELVMKKRNSKSNADEKQIEKQVEKVMDDGPESVLNFLDESGIALDTSKEDPKDFLSETEAAEKIREMVKTRIKLEKMDGSKRGGDLEKRVNKIMKMPRDSIMGFLGLGEEPGEKRLPKTSTKHKSLQTHHKKPFNWLYESRDFWVDLPLEIQQAAKTLGFTPRLWDTTEQPEESNCRWNDLSRGQQKAALVLGCDQDDWNGDNLPQFQPRESLDYKTSQKNRARMKRKPKPRSSSEWISKEKPESDTKLAVENVLSEYEARIQEQENINLAFEAALDEANAKILRLKEKDRMLISVQEELEAFCRRQKETISNMEKEHSSRLKAKDILLEALRFELIGAKEDITESDHGSEEKLNQDEGLPYGSNKNPGEESEADALRSVAIKQERTDNLLKRLEEEFDKTELSLLQREDELNTANERIHDLEAALDKQQKSQHDGSQQRDLEEYSDSEDTESTMIGLRKELKDKASEVENLQSQLQNAHRVIEQFEDEELNRQLENDNNGFADNVRKSQTDRQSDEQNDTIKSLNEQLEQLSFDLKSTMKDRDIVVALKNEEIESLRTELDRDGKHNMHARINFGSAQSKQPNDEKDEMNKFLNNQLEKWQNDLRKIVKDRDNIRIEKDSKIESLEEELEQIKMELGRNVVTRMPVGPEHDLQEKFDEQLDLFRSLMKQLEESEAALDKKEGIIKVLKAEQARRSSSSHTNLGETREELLAKLESEYANNRRAKKKIIKLERELDQQLFEWTELEKEMEDANARMGGIESQFASEKSLRVGDARGGSKDTLKDETNIQQGDDFNLHLKGLTKKVADARSQLEAAHQRLDQTIGRHRVSSVHPRRR